MILRHWRLIGFALITAALLGYALYNRAGWDRTQAKLDALARQAATVLVALRSASDNPKADWETAPGQIIALGESNRRLKGEIDATNQTIDQMAADAVRLRAKSAELRAIADKAEAQRRAAYARLSDMAATPGTRNDCMTLLREAEDALNIVRGAGL